MIKDSKYNKKSKRFKEKSRKEKSSKSLNHSFALFVILSLSLLSAADTVTFGFRTDIDWISIAYIVLIIVALLLGIAFMISRVFAMPQLEAWTKEEFVNLLISVAILVLFTGFAELSENVAHSLASDILSSTTQTGNIAYWYYKPTEGRWGLNEIEQGQTPDCPYPCHIYIARGFLGSLYERYGESLKSIAEYYFVSVFYMTENIGTGFDLTWGKFKFEFGFGYPLHAGLTIYNNILSIVVGEYLKIITALKMQEIALVYLTSLAGMLFILGIVSRSVWFLRKFGGLLVAAGVGLYFIFPMIYVLGWYTIDRSAVSFGIDLPDFQPGNVGGVLTGGLQGLGNINDLFTDFDNNRIGVLDALGRAYLAIIVLPILGLFTTIGFIRHFSPMIGGDVEIAGLTRII
jgi:hypothetical protein